MTEQPSAPPTTEADPKRRTRLILGAIAVLLALLAAWAAWYFCGPSADGTADQVITEQSVFAASVDVVNYGHDTSYGFTMYDLGSPEYAPISGDVVWPLQSAGASNCCVRLPREWRPGIKVRIEAEEDTYDLAKHEWRHIGTKFRQDLEIPRYAEPANLFVVFLPGQKVELVVSPAEPGHPQWTGSIKETPATYCLARHSAKECRAAQPKLGLSLSELQGYCTYQKEEGGNMKYCEDSIAECIYNYEDEELCKKTAWGARKSARTY